MKKYVNHLILAIVLFQSCDDVFEEDISDSKVTIIAPMDVAQISGNTVQFRWYEIEGALNYHVQIIKGDQLMILDSLVDTSVFDFQIDPGEYKWRVRAENFAYAGPYTDDHFFSVTSSLDLTDQKVGLLLPQDNLYLNSSEMSCSWKGISTADSYEFQLFKKVGSNETQILKKNLVEVSTQISGSYLEEDQEYTWKVKAMNSTSETGFFGRTFFLDRENPPVPNLVTPTVDQVFTVNNEVSFTWSFIDQGNIMSDINGIIEISSDENFGTILVRDQNSDNEFSNTFTTAGTYYWRVRGEDIAGNIGAYNSEGVIKVN